MSIRELFLKSRISFSKEDSNENVFSNCSLYDAWIIERRFFKDDSAKIVTFTNDGKLKLFGLDGILLKESAHFRNMFGGFVTPGGRIVTEDSDYSGTLSFWEADSLTRIKTISNSKLGSINLYYFLLSPSHAAYLDYYGKVVVFDFKNYNFWTISPGNRLNLMGMAAFRKQPGRYVVVCKQQRILFLQLSDKNGLILEKTVPHKTSCNRGHFCVETFIRNTEEFFVVGNDLGELLGNHKNTTLVKEGIEYALRFSDQTIILGGRDQIHTLDTRALKVTTFLRGMHEVDKDYSGSANHQCQIHFVGKEKKELIYVDKVNKNVKIIGINAGVVDTDLLERVEFLRSLEELEEDYSFVVEHNFTIKFSVEQFDVPKIFFFL